LQTNIADKENLISINSFDKKVYIKAPSVLTVDPNQLRSEPALVPVREPLHKAKKGKDEKQSLAVKSKQLNTINKGDKNSPYKKEELEKIYNHS